MPDSAINAQGDQPVTERCPAAPNGEHVPHWRDWRVAEREGRTVPCEHCGITIWPACSTCNQPRVGWETHNHVR